MAWGSLRSSIQKRASDFPESGAGWSQAILFLPFAKAQLLEGLTNALLDPGSRITNKPIPRNDPCVQYDITQGRESRFAGATSPWPFAVKTSWCQSFLLVDFRGRKGGPLFKLDSFYSTVSKFKVAYSDTKLQRRTGGLWKW